MEEHSSQVGLWDRRIGELRSFTAPWAAACYLVVGAVGCGDDEVGPSGSYRGSTDNSGFDYDYDYEPAFESDETGTVIGSQLAPRDEVGAWATEPPTFEVTYHVRPPGETYGNGDGSSWTNAISGLPAELERGARYYVASGEYYEGPWDDRFFQLEFEVPEADEKYVGIYKATGDEHGSDEGWDTQLMADGQARLGPISIVTGYLIIDGRRGIGGDNDAYGISISVRECEGHQDAPINFPWNCEARNVALRHLDARHCGHRPDPTLGAETVMYSYANGITRLVLENSYLHEGFRGLVFLQNSQDILVEGNAFARAGLHHEAHTLAFRDSQNIVVRRNVLIDSYGVFISLQGASSVRISGNVFRRTLEDWDVWAGIMISDSGNNVAINNNTFHNLAGLNVGVREAEEGMVAGLQVVNNLWAGSRTNQIMLRGSHEHNAFYDNARDGNGLDNDIDEPSKQVLADDPFVDAAAGDLRLAMPTDPGQSLPEAFAWDLAGNPRGQDGSWDRGAYEYNK